MPSVMWEDWFHSHTSMPGKNKYEGKYQAMRCQKVNNPDVGIGEP